MSETQDIYCPFCGELMFEEVDINNADNLGKNCPNYCGWISVEIQGEDVAVKSSPTTY